MHVAEKYCQIKSLAEEGLTDLLSPFSRIVFFPHHFAVDSSMATTDGCMSKHLQKYIKAAT